MKQDKNMRIKWKTWRREDAPPAQVHRTDTPESLFLLNVLLRQMMIQELKGRRVVYVCLVKQIWVTSWNTKQDLWGMSLQLQLQLLAGPSVVGSVVLVSVWISSISATEEVFVPRLVSANLLLCQGVNFYRSLGLLTGSELSRQTQPAAPEYKITQFAFHIPSFVFSHHPSSAVTVREEQWGCGVACRHWVRYCDAFKLLWLIKTNRSTQCSGHRYLQVSLQTCRAEQLDQDHTSSSWIKTVWKPNHLQPAWAVLRWQVKIPAVDEACLEIPAGAERGTVSPSDECDWGSSQSSKFREHPVWLGNAGGFKGCQVFVTSIVVNSKMEGKKENLCWNRRRGGNETKWKLTVCTSHGYMKHQRIIFCCAADAESGCWLTVNLFHLLGKALNFNHECILHFSISI